MEIATQMRGRALVSEMFPFSFREYMGYLGWEIPTRWTTGKRAEARNALEGYWASGGFPEVLGVDRRTRVRIHQDYFQSILFRDLIDRHDISHPRAVADAARRLVDNASSAYTLNSLLGHLQALGHKAPKDSVGDYVRWFEDAYFLFTVRLFDASLARSNTNPKKIYSVDHALVNSVSSGILVNSGHLLENLVFVALRRLWRDIFYYRTRNGFEVDFIVSCGPGERRLVQVCESLADPGIAARETRALEAAMGDLGLHEATLVTREETRTIRCPAGRIEVIPVWRFLLELPDFLV
jgi:predicted AAA+ superfamily ATPase